MRPSSARFSCSRRKAEEGAVAWAGTAAEKGSWLWVVLLTELLGAVTAAEAAPPRTPAGPGRLCVAARWSARLGGGPAGRRHEGSEDVRAPV